MVRALGVDERPLSGYWAVVELGLRVDQIEAPLTGNPVESTTETRSHRRRKMLPPAASGCQAGLRTGSCDRSIVTAYRYAFEVPSTCSALCNPRTFEKSTPMYES